MTVEPDRASVYRATRPIPQKKETTNNTLSLRDIVGKGYDDMFSFHGRYICIKGSRASKKSKTTAIYIILKMMNEEKGCVLCVRKTAETLRDSCYSDLKWAAERLGVQRFFKFRENPLKITYIPHGTYVLFRGLDDSMKVTSISYEDKVLTTIWFEEVYEIDDIEDFRKINESMRGVVPPGHEKRVIVTLNPWSDKHWIKKEFFDRDDPDILAFTTNYLCNEWLDDADRKVYEDMKRRNPRRYRVAGLGEWGVSDGVVYENWEELWFDPKDIFSKARWLKPFYGLDFGYSTSPTAFVAGFCDLKNKNIWIYDEIYKTGLTNMQLYHEIAYKGYAKERIVADSAEPKSIAELQQLGCNRIVKARKGNDSVVYGIQLVQQFHIYVHPSCVNTITELSNYRWQRDKSGNILNKPEPEYDHICDALRYAIMGISRSAVYSFK